ncbi:hypothetical protein E9549_18635 [Blastococcus sp. MG754426]|uniref:hypothetical protein n=1 Tax=unclassified Blastococcus TaxID=2619396 RepID=UPI001EF0C126|nr:MULTISPECIES: hypothetical protein [unclassified Blastococcus]MCF6509404.1 hypothetical protein [Blastococcus sp. MG754426]MCF6513897.1 hypothetical protein [Blastococcus sp. MG754427]
MTVTGRTSGAAPPAAAPAGLPLGALGVLAALGGLACILVELAGAVGWILAALTPLAVGALTAVHAGLVALALPRAGAATRLVVAAVLGLATAGVAVWLSGVAGWFALRWLVVAAPVLAWLSPSARSAWRSGEQGAGALERLRRYGPLLWGLAGTWFLASRVLATAFEPLTGPAAWQSFYVDIPWHIALTAEGLDRAPAVYPWIPDVPIGYSWLFFGSLALLGNLTGATAAQLVLAVGPTVLAVLVPAALAVCTWVVSRSRVAVVVAPLLFSLTRAPVFGHVEGVQLTSQWVLINRDSTNAMVLAIATLLVLQLRAATEDPDRARRARWASLLVLFVIAFAVAGSRGGSVLPVLGAAGLSWLFALRHRERRPVATWSLALVVLAVPAATFAVTRSSGSFRLDPLSFLPAQVIGSEELPLGSLASLAGMLAMTAAVALVARHLPYARPAVPVLAGAALAGVLGVALFGHPSFSQLYFFHATWPLLVVGLAVLVALAVVRLGPLALLALGAAVVAVQVVLQPPALLPPTPWTVRVVLAGLVAGVVVGAVAVVLARRHGAWATGTLLVPAAVVALQPWALPEIVHGAVVAEPAETTATVSDGQLDLLDELRTRSDADDLVATNKHCLDGSLTTGRCDARWFTVAAFAERRVLVEGWSYDYTWESSGTDNHEPYWDQELLRANDGFIADPSPATCRTLGEAGVDWLYVDHREPWSPRLAEYAVLVDETGDAGLYRFTGDCG